MRVFVPLLAVTAVACSFERQDATMRSGVETDARAALTTVSRHPELASRLAKARTWSAAGDGFRPDPGERSTWSTTDASLDVRISGRASGSLYLALATDPSLWITVTDPLAHDVPGRRVGSALVFEESEAGVDTVYLSTKGITEELRVLRSARDRAHARYRVERGPGVSSIRVVDGRVEVLDRNGAVRITSEPWTAFDAFGVRRDARVFVEGDVIDAELDTSDLAFPVVWDPAWLAVPNAMSESRRDFPLVKLASGKVLAGAGGVATAEVLDPATGAWTATGALTEARAFPGYAPLGNGKILVAGGTVASSAVSTAETYDPPTGTWSLVKGMATARSAFQLVSLDASLTLAIGGRTSSGSGGTDVAERYDVATNTWTSSTMVLPRYSYAAARLGTGKVLVAGGVSVACAGPCTTAYVSSAELYDPTTNAWTATASMAGPRLDHRAVTLANGRALVVGGRSFPNDASELSTAELFDPTTNTWTTIAPMGTPRRNPLVELLPTGAVLVAGGQNGTTLLSSAEIFAASTWLATDPMAMPHLAGSMAKLADGRILVAGGLTATATLTTATEIFTEKKSNGTACAVTSECTSGQCVDGVCCATSCGGPCEACDGAGAGTCHAIEGAPHGVRPACGAGQTCNGLIRASCVASDACVRATCASAEANCGTLGDGCGGSINCGGCTLPNETCGGGGIPGRCGVGTCTVKSCAQQGFQCGRQSDGCAGMLECGTCTSGMTCGGPGITNRCVTPAATGLPLGSPCTGNPYCASGFCADGVCCQNACLDPCQSCAEPAMAGTCINLSTPRAPKTCGTFQCSALGCRTTCTAATASSDCIPGATCIGSMCVAGSDGGVADAGQASYRCTSDSECMMRLGLPNCSKGYCCQALCTGTCHSCAVPSALGKCTPYTGPSIGAECASGSCSNGSCSTSPGSADLGIKCAAGAECMSGNCVDGVCCDSPCEGTCRQCNLPGSTGLCKPFTGIAKTAECPDPAMLCEQGQCRKPEGSAQPIGTACTAGAQCATANCSDNVCCDADCTESCRACNTIGKEGTCTGLYGMPSHPLRPCPGGERCGPDGACPSVGDTGVDAAEDGAVTDGAAADATTGVPTDGATFERREAPSCAHSGARRGTPFAILSLLAFARRRRAARARHRADESSAPVGPS